MKTPSNFAQGLNTRSLTVADYAAIAHQYNLITAHVQAVVKVEAGNAGFWNDGNMKLLYEGHIAYRETTGALRDKLVAAGLAWKDWGDVAYGKASQSRERLRKAIEIAGDRAYRWASYGLGQIMGFNCEVCDFTSAKQMFEHFLTGEAAQVDGMMRFIKGKSILNALRDGAWKTFAYVYNGSGYAKNRYDTRLAEAFRQFSKGVAQPSPADPNPWSDGSLTIGDMGLVIEKIQRILVDNGAKITIDGHFGRATAQAVRDFQKANGLTVDGIVGKKTDAVLQSVKPPVSPVAPVITMVGAGVLAGLFSWLADIPCEYLNLFCGG